VSKAPSRFHNGQESIALPVVRTVAPRQLFCADYLKRQIRSAHGVRLTVAIRSPQEERCLQAVDMLSWAVFRQLELGDDAYRAIMQERLMVSNLFS
jgi:hypothetical protein